MIEQYKLQIKKLMSEKRFVHSVSVAREAVKLAKIYGVDSNKAEISGLLHDVTKDMSKDDQLQIVRCFGIIMTDIEFRSAKLWHAITAPVYLEKIFGIKDRDILNAVRYHTTGRACMSKLEKIIFVADSISEDRKYSGVEKLRKKAYVSLEEAMLIGINFTLNELTNKKYLIAPDTIFAYNEIMMKFI
ncbi:MAG: diadenosine tetraphosphatase [Eubacteriales bacterium SKADARSKE-1]|nr:diadenosine tetraphosphatase [Eubacteriales bacterium SKADARSKE-1]